MTARIDRRGFVRTAAGGAAVVGSGILASSFPAHAADLGQKYALARTRPVKGVQRTAAALPANANPVSLYCSVLDQTDYDADNNGSFTLICGNDSPNATTGPISLKILMPFLTQVTGITAPNGWNVNELHDDPVSYTPSLYQITSTQPLGAGASFQVTVGLHALASTPNRPPGARAIFSTDLANTTDYDTDMIQNWWTPTLVRTSLTRSQPGNVNLVFSSNGAVFAPGSSPQQVPFSFYNYAGSLLQGTRSPSNFYFWTPPYAFISASGRPSGLSVVYEDNNDPMIPSIYKLSVPAGVGALGPEVPATINIPWYIGTDNVSGYAPLGPLTALGIYTPDGNDSQGDLSTAYHAWALFTAITTGV